jgi:hypothetical protein
MKKLAHGTSAQAAALELLHIYHQTTKLISHIKPVHASASSYNEKMTCTTSKRHASVAPMMQQAVAAAAVAVTNGCSGLYSRRLSAGTLSPVTPPAPCHTFTSPVARSVLASPLLT